MKTENKATATLRKNPSVKVVFSDIRHLLAFGFGSGLAPIAPGSWGTLAAIPLYLLCAELPLLLYISICILGGVVGIYLCGYSASNLKVHDHPGIVWDEFVGFFITMTGFTLNWHNLLLGFFLFRIFDILKPWPIKWIDQRVTGGLGIMLDDVVAGLFAWSCLFGINYLWL